jgi:hypothetical protein
MPLFVSIVDDHPIGWNISILLTLESLQLIENLCDFTLLG